MVISTPLATSIYDKSYAELIAQFPGHLPLLLERLKRAISEAAAASSAASAAAGAISATSEAAAVGDSAAEGSAPSETAAVESPGKDSEGVAKELALKKGGPKVLLQP